MTHSQRQAATAQLPQSGPAAQSAATASQGDQHAESSDLLAMRNEACEEIASAALLLDRITSEPPREQRNLAADHVRLSSSTAEPFEGRLCSHFIG